MLPRCEWDRHPPAACDLQDRYTDVKMNAQRVSRSSVEQLNRPTAWTERLEALRKMQRALDSAFRVPGTNLRFGWDPLIGLVPWAGDFLTAAMSCAIVVSAHQMGVPRTIQLRMLLTIAIDVIVGLVPFLGDAADVFWKANSRNMALLERHATPGSRPSMADRMFVGVVLAALIAIAAAPVLLVYWAVTTLGPRS
jgi:hypothetical protein